MLRTTIRLLIVGLLLVAIPASATLQLNQLSGFGTRIANPITSITLTATNTSTGTTIAAPATVNAGGLLVLYDYASNAAAGDPGDVIPTGFTGATTLFSNRFRVRASYKLTDGTEDGATITGMDGDQSDQKVLLYFEANKPITGFRTTGVSGGGAISTADPAEQTLPITDDPPAILGITAFGCAGCTIDPRTTSITPDHETSSGTTLYVHDKFYATAATDYTWDMVDEGNGNMLSGFFFRDLRGGP